MRNKFIFLSFFVLLAASSGAVSAQTTTATPTAAAAVKFVQGDVISISANKIVLQTKDGSIDVDLSDKTEFRRASPENPSLKTAVASALSEFGVGDKLIVTGNVSADKKSIPAKTIYLMRQSDIAQKQNKERDEWRARGITGQVAALNAQTKEVTVSQRGIGAERKILLTAKDNADFRRYAEGSVDYNEAKNSSFNDIKVGDSIRALGEKSEDGASIKAERVVFGSFQTVGGAITAIDAAKGEITINNFQTKKNVTIIVGKNSVLKQFPAEMAQRMMQFQTGASVAPGQGAVRPPQTVAAGAGQGQNPMRQGGADGGGMRGGVRGGGNIDDMLERFPNISVTDLKVGDMIAVSSTKGANADRLNAIKLLSGVEPFIKAQQQTAVGRPRGTQEAGLSIPGLDGSNFP